MRSFFDMGCLRVVSSLQVQVSCEKEPYKRDHFLQKRPINWRSLLIVATPHEHTQVWHKTTHEYVFGQTTHVIAVCDLKRLVVLCDQFHVWHDSFTCVTWLIQNWSHMGWLRWVGCLKIYVSLQNIGLFCRSLLQKRPIFLSILLIVATP